MIRKIVGWFLVFLPLWAWLLVGISKFGWLAASIALGVGALVIGCIVLGLWLVES